MKAAELKKLKTLLKKTRNIVIVTHWSPDGDAMGSSLGLYNYLALKKHKVTVITPNDYPAFLAWLPGNNKVIDFSVEQEKAKKAVEKAELICTLDFNSMQRIERLGKYILDSAAPKLLIDHHPQPENYASFNLHNTKASSTCELVYELIHLLGDRKRIEKKIASCLYTGIMTDTGSFRFNSTTPRTHRIVAELIEAGAVNHEIHGRIYDTNTEDRMKLLGYCLCEKMKVFPGYHTALISLSSAELERFNYKKGDTEGVVNYALAIEGIRFGAFFVERDGKIKTSFRSKGDFDVNKFARAHFQGGGHRNAAGGMSDIGLEETVTKFEGLLPSYKKELE